MTKQSDTNGRGFEYCFCESVPKLLDEYTVKFSHRAFINQERDAEKFYSLNENKQKYFNSQSKKIITYLQKTYFPSPTDITIDRLNDGEGGVKRNPTDVVIGFSSKKLNVSLKHNNLSLKHQRIPSLFSQIGIEGHADENSYRQKIKEISNNFYKKTQSLDLNITLFSEVKELDNRLIYEGLYKKTMTEYTKILDRFRKDKHCCRSYFTFLVGNQDYLQVTMSQSIVDLKFFNKIKLPDTLSTTPVNDSNYLVQFDNGFTFNLRIHTASSRMEKCTGKCCDMKIDTTLVKENIKKLTLQ